VIAVTVCSTIHDHMPTIKAMMPLLTMIAVTACSTIHDHMPTIKAMIPLLCSDYLCGLPITKL